MKRILRWLIWIPVAIVLIAFSMANRELVPVSFDPIEPAEPALTFQVPLYALLFVVLALGILIGGVAAWTRQGKWRRAAREAEHMRRQAAARRPTLSGGPQLGGPHLGGPQLGGPSRRSAA